MFSRLLQSAALFSLQITSTATKRCRCFPGDACWPSNASWNSLNQTVGGRLIATTPLAAPCHFDAFAQYNGSACKSLQEAWFWPRIQYFPLPVSVLAFARADCVFSQATSLRRLSWRHILPIRAVTLSYLQQCNVSSALMSVTPLM